MSNDSLSFTAFLTIVLAHKNCKRLAVLASVFYHEHSINNDRVYPCWWDGVYIRSYAIKQTCHFDTLLHLDGRSSVVQRYSSIFSIEILCVAARNGRRTNKSGEPSPLTISATSQALLKYLNVTFCLMTSTRLLSRPQLIRIHILEFAPEETTN